MQTTLAKTIDAYLKHRESSGLLRKLTPGVVKQGDHTYLHLNDYLQLSQHPKIIQAAQAAIEKWGTTSSGSPVVGSYWPIHEQLEYDLKTWCGFEYALLWNSGYTANKALMSALPQKGDVILADRYVHNSLIIGAKETGAKLIRYHHLNLNHLEDLLRTYTSPCRTVFVVTESVFSMEGDYPDLLQMSQLKDRYHFFWIVDEAHAIGWHGPKGNGLVAQFGVADKVDILVATLGKSLASQGAFTLFHQLQLRSYLLNCTPEFIYSTYLTPAATAASKAAIDVIQTQYVAQQSHRFAQTLQFKKRLQRFFPTLPLTDSPIVPLVIPDPQQMLQVAKQLLESKIHVGAIRPPSVPVGGSRLRLSLHAHLEFESLAQTLEDFFIRAGFIHS